MWHVTLSPTEAASRYKGRGGRNQPQYENVVTRPVLCSREQVSHYSMLYEIRNA